MRVAPPPQLAALQAVARLIDEHPCAAADQGAPSCGLRDDLAELETAILRAYGGCGECMRGCPDCQAACSAADLQKTLPALEARLRGTQAHRRLAPVWALPRPPAIRATPRCARAFGPGPLPGAACRVQDRSRLDAPLEEPCAEGAECVPPGVCRELCDPAAGALACPGAQTCTRYRNVDRTVNVCS